MPENRSKSFRPEIQALRGIAVIVVLFYHAQIGGLDAGYLGVDIFYVVSGFLITGILKSQISAAKFSFRDFYFRRAKRLLPASYVVLFVTGIASAWLLTGEEFDDLVIQLIGSVTFTTNFVLLDQSDYFSSDADLKPLLHMWSLAIEEQFYLLCPLALWLTPRRFWLPGIVLVLIVSPAGCLLLGRSSPQAAFYLMPTRAWELALGSLGCFVAAPSRLTGLASVLAYPAVVAIVTLPFFPIDAAHPGVDAIIVCVATLVIILARSGRVGHSSPVAALGWVGNFSYSLYLVHWPLFAFAQNVYFSSTVPLEVRAGLLVLSLVLGYGLYRLVEEPARRSSVSYSPQIFKAALAASAVLVAAPFALSLAISSDRDYAHDRRVNYGFDIACESGTNFTPRSKCRNSAEPRILVWGDSFAMHLVPGIADTTDLGVEQATRSVCAPFANLTPTDAIYTRDWGESCLAFNRSILSYLAGSSIETVVLASAFNQYVDPSARTLSFEGGNVTEYQADIPRAVNAMAEMIAAVRALGKRVVVIAPPPRPGFNIGLCLERRDAGKLTLGKFQDCTFSTRDYRMTQASVLDFLDSLRLAAAIDVISFDDLLCGHGTCQAILDGKFVYRDGHHLSHDGSKAVARRIGLGEMIDRRAR